MNKNIVVIIPAYNEEKNIGPVLRSIKEKIEGVEVVVIDDGSTDRTVRMAKNEGVTIVSLFINMGYGIALQTGYKYALRKGYRYLVQMDADGQHGISSLESLISEILKDKADIILGSRFLGELRYKISLVRRIGMRLFAYIASLFIGQRITDPTSGFRAINRKVMLYYAQKIFPSDYPDADVLIMSQRAGFKIKEVPVVMHQSKGTKSMHSGLKPIYYIYKMLLSILSIVLRRYPKQD